jgi:hypothetical protein
VYEARGRSAAETRGLANGSCSDGYGESCAAFR